jgi:protein-disulfide isomerase
VLRTQAILSTCAVALGLLAIGCEKSSAGNQDGYKDIGKSFDDSEPKPEERKPVEGVDLASMSEANRNRFEKLVDQLASPCGKAHSLRTSRNTDASCVRAPFAVTYVVELLADGASDKEVVDLYEDRYREQPRHAFNLSATPRLGPDDAPVKLVEFYDYGCPACKMFAPELDRSVRAFPTGAVLYYKQFPLAAHADSGPAAKAALAAHKQGKFDEMHKLLFQNASHPEAKHKLEDLKGYAKSLGLDMSKFMQDFAAAEAQITADKNEGIGAGVQSTPTLFINGREFKGPQGDKYLKMFIEEEIALSR